MFGISVLVVLICAFCGLILTGLLYQQLGKRKDARLFPATGRYVTIRNRRVHIRENGSGPSVVLEAGIASSSLAWISIQQALLKEARVLAYDRLGLGWSESPGSTRTLGNAVAELHDILEASELPSPYVLVGHSYGGLIVREFAMRYPEQVTGLVLVDPVDTRDWVPLSEAQRSRLARGVRLSRRGALLARLGVVRFALALLLSGNRKIPQLISRWTAGKGASVTERLTGEVRKLPAEVWPMIRMHWSDEKCFRTMADYLEQLPANAAAAAQSGWPSNVLVIVLTVLTATAEFPYGVIHRLASRSGHWIQLDEPELVLEAIRDVLKMAANRTSRR